MIGACGLQALRASRRAARCGRQSGQQTRSPPRSNRAARSSVRRAADVRANVGGTAQRRTPPCSDDVDQQAALDGAEERDAVERLIALEVGHAVVQVSRRAPKGDRRFDDCGPRATRPRAPPRPTPLTLTATPPSTACHLTAESAPTTMSARSETKPSRRAASSTSTTRDRQWIVPAGRTDRLDQESPNSRSRR